ncbi:MAG: hypothetical protein IMX02_03660 [Limnochordaceae bacterium]|nr:hypothetical protein [Limnochordaceae bacterium]
MRGSTRTLARQICRVVAAVLLMAAGAGLRSVAVRAGSTGGGLPDDPAAHVALFDVAGASSSASAVLLNPAAAAQLGRPLVAGWAVVPSAGSAPGDARPLYAVALLDPGTGGPGASLSGGLTGVFRRSGTDTPGDGELLRLAYTVAARIGSVALGARAGWERRLAGADPEQQWTADVGFRTQLGAWLAVGGAIAGIPVGASDLAARARRGSAGLTISFPGLAGGPLEGSLLALGWDDANLESGAGTTLVASGRLAANRMVALDAAAGYDPSTRQLGYWAVALAVLPSPFGLEIGYSSSRSYRLGIDFQP